MKVHFISLGGTVMHSLAIALQKQGHTVTGSDNEFLEPARSRLSEQGLLPDKPGWEPDRIHPGLDAVILGLNTRRRNKEYLKARELGLKIYSFPEYIYEHSKQKKGVVIGGCYGKRPITAIVMHVLKENKVDFDYVVSSRITCFDDLVKLSDEAPFIIIEGDEYLSSPIDRTPKFHRYNPHMTLLSGISWDHMDAYRTFENYKKQFRKFLKIATGGGKVFYYEGDPVLGDVVDKSHWSLLKIPYGEHPYRVEGDRFILESGTGDVPLNIIGRHNMQNISGAQLLCRDLGIDEEMFYKAIKTFMGPEKRQQLLAQGSERSVFLDFAHAPSTVEATIEAFRETYPDQELITCLELHTYSSLNKEYLPLYRHSLDKADKALVYFNPKVVRRKRLPALEPEEVQEYFGKPDLTVFTELDRLTEELANSGSGACVLLLMTSGSFSGLDLQQLARELVKDPNELF